MIDIERAVNFLEGTFAPSHDHFNWGDNAILKGSLENLPMPEVIKQFPKGIYYAMFDILNVNPNLEDEGLFFSAYHFSVILCKRGKDGDITKIRSDMASQYLVGFAAQMERDQVGFSIDNVFPRVNEVETTYDSIAVMVVGTITMFN